MSWENNEHADAGVAPPTCSDSENETVARRRQGRLRSDQETRRLPEPAFAPPVMAGLFSLRGRIVGVLHLDRLLELPAPAAGPFRALVVLSQREFQRPVASG